MFCLLSGLRLQTLCGFQPFWPLALAKSGASARHVASRVGLLSAQSIVLLLTFHSTRTLRGKPRSAG